MVVITEMVVIYRIVDYLPGLEVTRPESGDSSWDKSIILVKTVIFGYFEQFG